MTKRSKSTSSYDQREDSFDLEQLQIDKSGAVPLYQQVVDTLQAAVSSKKLKPGDALPPIRSLAERLDVNQMTVAKAYRILADRKIIQGKSGGGTRVIGDGTAFEKSGVPPTGDFSARMAEFSVAPGVIALTDAYPRMTSQAALDFGNCIHQVIQTRGRDIFAYAAPTGSPGLRRLLTRLVEPQGIEVDPEQLIITSGAQQAIDLVARHLLKATDTVLVESPSYFHAIDAFKATGATIVELPVRDGGIDVGELKASCERHKPRLLYTIPTVQNPTGVTVTQDRRQAIAEVASHFGCGILEDDYCPEFSFQKTPQRSYLANATGKVDVYYVRSLGKSYLPGVRLGFLIPPTQHVDALLRLRRTADLHSSNFIQEAAELFLEKRGGHLRKPLDMAPIQARALTLYNALRKFLPSDCSTRMIDGGFSFWVSLPKPINDRDLYFAAVENSVAFAPGSNFHAASPDLSDGIRLSYGRLDEPELVEAAMRTSKALSRILQQRETNPAYIF